MKAKKVRGLSRTITNEYLDRRLSVLVTKIDLKEEFEKHEEQHRKDRDEILTKLDGIAGELQVMREENAAGTIILRDHEERIKVLERAA